MDNYAGPDADARLEAIGKVAAELDVTPNQLVLAWLLHQTAPTPVTLVGPRTPAQLEAALAAVHVQLSAEQLGRLDSAGA
jgi:aryl-alcohol dehydrogenase-like predicted oxidoreductase